MSPCHHVTMSPCLHVTMSPCHHVSMSPCHHVTRDSEILNFWDSEPLRFWEFETLRLGDFESFRLWDFACVVHDARIQTHLLLVEESKKEAFNIIRGTWRTYTKGYPHGWPQRWSADIFWPNIWDPWYWFPSDPCSASSLCHGFPIQVNVVL